MDTATWGGPVVNLMSPWAEPLPTLDLVIVRCDRGDIHKYMKIDLLDYEIGKTGIIVTGVEAERINRQTIMIPANKSYINVNMIIEIQNAAY